MYCDGINNSNDGFVWLPKQKYQRNEILKLPSRFIFKNKGGTSKEASPLMFILNSPPFLVVCRLVYNTVVRGVKYRKLSRNLWC